MESTTQFDLNQAVAQWIGGLRKRRHFKHEDLEELESHLLDQLDEWKATGLSDQQAFQVSLAQMGEVECLAEEYCKVNSWYVRRKRMYAVGNRFLTTKRVAAFSVLFVGLTFGSIFGQKAIDRHRPLPKAASTGSHPADSVAHSPQ